jgi:hypothetical protein
MKPPVALVLALAFLVVARAQTAAPAVPAANPPASKTAPAVKAPAAKATTPAAKAPAPKAVTKKKEEPPAKIDGTTIPRGKKFLGLQLVNGTFKLSFYDEKKKPVAADVTRAVLRWDPKYKVGKERLLLTLGEDGKSLSSQKAIRPPYQFKLFITLLKDATETEEAVGETFVIDFSA